MTDEGGYPVGSRQVHHYVAQMNLGRFSIEPDRENPPLWTLESGSGKIRKSSVRNEAAITDYNRLDDSDGEHGPELAEQAFSEIETLARPVLDKIAARHALAPASGLRWRRSFNCNISEPLACARTCASSPGRLRSSGLR
jgi:hypothetical protein